MWPLQGSKDWSVVEMAAVAGDNWLLSPCPGQGVPDKGLTTSYRPAQSTEVPGGGLSVSHLPAQGQGFLVEVSPLTHIRS